MASYSVSNATELMAALAKVTSGDTIVLSGGSYGDVSISKLSFASDVVIKSADATNPATFNTISISGSSGLSFQGIAVKFTPTETTLSSDSAVKVASSSDISFIGSTVTGGPAVNGVDPSATSLDSTGNVIGYPTARGFTVTKSTDVTIECTDISMFHRGIVLNDVSGIILRGNDIHHVRSVPINGADVSNTLVEDNYLHDIMPWKYGPLGGDHGDFIHFWTSPTTQTSASTNIIIKDNFLDQGDGTAVLGIYLDDNDNGWGFSNVQITGNVIYNGDHQGLRLEHVFNSVVDGNILLQSSGELKKGPGIVLQGDTSGLSITNNVLSGLDLTGLSGDARGNVLVQSIDPTASNYSGNLAGDVLTWLEALAIRQHFTGETYVSGPAPGDTAGIGEVTDPTDTGGSTDGSTGGDTGGSTDGSTGGSTDGSTGGTTDGSTGGTTDGSTGGTTDGSTGGTTDGSTGGTTDGSTGGTTDGSTGGTTDGSTGGTTDGSTGGSTGGGGGGKGGGGNAFGKIKKSEYNRTLVSDDPDSATLATTSYSTTTKVKVVLDSGDSTSTDSGSTGSYGGTDSGSGSHVLQPVASDPVYSHQPATGDVSDITLLGANFADFGFESQSFW